MDPARKAAEICRCGGLDGRRAPSPKCSSCGACKFSVTSLDPRRRRGRTASKPSPDLVLAGARGLASIVLFSRLMHNVADIMTRKVLTVSPDAYVADAAWGLTLKGVSGAPVRDDRGNLVGVLSKSDLVDPEKSDSDPDHPRTVEDSMTPLLYAAKSTDSVGFAARRMVETGVHRVVVIDESGKIVGIVTPIDILRGLLDGKLETADFARKR